MSITVSVEQKALSTLLTAMQPICTKRSAIEATSSILLNIGHREMILKSTDLEISLQASCPLEASTVREPVSLLVPGRRLYECVRELDGIISLTIEGSQLRLGTDMVDIALNTRDADDFPPFPERIENRMHFERDSLAQLLDRVSFLIPQNNANPSLNGLYLEIGSSGLSMTATDGHCLAQVTTAQYTLPERQAWLLPRRAVFELKKLLETCHDADIFLGMCSGHLVFSGEHFNFFTKLLADAFPQYKSVMNREGFVPAAVDKARFSKMLRRSASLLSGQFIATRFGFEPHALRVSVTNKEVGRLTEELVLKEYSGEKIEMRFYAPYILNGIQALDGDEVRLYLHSATRPILFESVKPELTVTYLVMPVSPSTNQ